MKTKRLVFWLHLALIGGLLIALSGSLWHVQPVRADVTIIYVDKDATGANNGTSWANAYTTLQAALAVTNANGSTTYEIWVAEGTYTPGSARTDSFRIERNNVQLYGGFAGTETARDQRNWVAHPTILSGDIGTENNNSDNAYHVVYVNGVTYESITGATVIDGFTITAGNADGSWPNYAGGGLYCNGAGSGHACNPTLRNVTFSGNTATDSGGGMYNAGYNGGASSPTLTNVTFSNNSARYGGGMYNFGYSGTSSPTLTNVTFSGNTTTDYGGGMYNAGYNGGASSPTLTNVTFSNNSANRGGGMYNGGESGVSSPTLTNVTFSDNRATEIGGGMYNNGSNGGVSSPTLTNVTFSGNSAQYGGGMYNFGYSGTSSPTLTNCILWGNTASSSGAQMYNDYASPTVSYSDIQGGCPSGATCGAGMLYADPEFVNAAGGNLRLKFSSPAIDAGNNAAVPVGITTDLDGNPRFVDIRSVSDTGNGTPPIVDMGAYEAGYTIFLPLVLRNNP
jgi:hypothetical protein